MAQRKTTRPPITKEAYDEKEARINGLKIALVQAQADTIAYLEAAVSAFLMTAEPSQIEKIDIELFKVEGIVSEPREVCLPKDKTKKSKRQEWREEISKLQEELDEVDVTLYGEIE